MKTLFIITTAFLFLVVCPSNHAASSTNTPSVSDNGAQSRRAESKIDPIDQLVTRLSATHGLWRNGRWMPINLPEAASTEQVLEQMFQMTGFNKGYVTNYKILTIRRVHIDGDLYTAAFVQTVLGNKIALFTAGGRWNRIYDK